MSGCAIVLISPDSVLIALGGLTAFVLGLTGLSLALARR